MPKTLAQIRAANALTWKDRDFGGKNEGNVVSGFPMLIKTAGLLAALAYAVERKEQRDDRGRTTGLVPKNKGEFVVAVAALHHLVVTHVLTTPGNVAQLAEAVSRLTPTGRVGEKFFDAADGFIGELAGASDSSQLRRATAEALAFLSYLKRFVV